MKDLNANRLVPDGTTRRLICYYTGCLRPINRKQGLNELTHNKLQAVIVSRAMFIATRAMSY